MKVFVSYTHSDWKYLNDLNVALVNSGVVCLSDKLIPAGEYWYEYVADWIRECHAVVVVVSQNTLGNRTNNPARGRSQQSEIALSADSGKRVIAILLHMDESELPGWLKLLLGSGQRLRSVSGIVDAQAITEALAGTRQPCDEPVRKRRKWQELVYLVVGFAIGITVLATDGYLRHQPGPPQAEAATVAARQPLDEATESKKYYYNLDNKVIQNTFIFAEDLSQKIDESKVYYYLSNPTGIPNYFMFDEDHSILRQVIARYLSNEIPRAPAEPSKRLQESTL